MKTNSQTYARIFAVISTILLIPALFGLLISLFIIQLFLILLPIVIIGSILLCGYYKRKNNNLDEKWNVRLWLGTIIFNGLLFLLTFVTVFAQIIREKDLPDNDLQIFGGLISFGYFILTSLGIYALNAAKTENMQEKAKLASKP